MSAASEPNSRAAAGTRIFENANIVLPTAVMLGWIAVSGDRIIEVGEGRAPERGLDCAGDLLVPGLIDLHTDHLENHLQPRPKVAWPPLAAVVAYDAQIAASAITTVFDSVRVGSDLAYRSVTAELTAILAAIEAARVRDLLRAEHRLHVRCEICAEDVVEQTGWLLEVSDAKLMSLMDHTPGARQFCDLGAWKTYYGGKSGLPASELERFMQTRRAQFAANYLRHRAALVALAKAHRIVTASHDDATLAHVQEAIADGAAIAEFPTTAEAAAACHGAGVAVLMGAPNVVRGGSHSGNVAAEALAREGVLDILASDYVPASLLLGAFDLARRVDGYGLPAALRTVTLHPARAAGLNDRGQIAAGLRADLARIRMVDELPVVREVYRGGRRVI
jgi:alpha-D-ribose 1-methylphosphonate 5-triphosphate diphosphatase